MTLGQGLPAADLADQYRRIYRTQFKADVAAGLKKPFVFHLCFWGIFILPILYLSIPHRRRPWLYRTRWLVLAVCLTLNFWMLRNVTSGNFAFAYGSGLCAAWGTVWNLTVLVWTRPQWDAKRVQPYPNPRFEEHVRLDDDENTAHPALASGAQPVMTNGHAANGHGELKQRKQDAAERLDRESKEEDAQRKKDILTYLQRDTTVEGGGMSHDDVTFDFNQLNKKQPFIYKWQRFPDDAPFLTRLDWAFDIATTMRLTGWNWAIHVLPPYEPPPWFDEKKTYQVPLDYFPNRTPQGYERCPHLKQFLRERLLQSFIPCYLAIDFCATFMTQDPYFVLGPNDLPLPPTLASMNPFLLSLRRTLVSFVAIIVALRFAWDFGAVLLAVLGRPVLGFRVDPWHLPSMTGSFTQVLDRGLAGFWGSWWHQTFRFGFAAPTKWLIRNGYLRERSSAAAAVGALVAFVQSGFLHAMGSYTTVPETHWWEPPIFFFLSGVGTQLQSVLSKAFRTQIRQMPRWVRRAGNLVFVVAWLHVSCKFLLDDFGRCGIWLWEPVPFSFARWLGFGLEGQHWWRWVKEDNPTWITGQYWWQSGIGI